MRLICHQHNTASDTATLHHCRAQFNHICTLQPDTPVARCPRPRWRRRRGWPAVVDTSNLPDRWLRSEPEPVGIFMSPADAIRGPPGSPVCSGTFTVAGVTLAWNGCDLWPRQRADSTFARCRGAPGFLEMVKMVTFCWRRSAILMCFKVKCSSRLLLDQSA